MNTPAPHLSIDDIFKDYNVHRVPDFTPYQPLLPALGYTHEWPLPTPARLEACLALAYERRSSFARELSTARSKRNVEDIKHWEDKWFGAGYELETMQRVCGIGADAGEESTQGRVPIDEFLDGLTPDLDITPQCKEAMQWFGVGPHESFPKGLGTKLYPFQIAGVRYLLHTEKYSSQRGGILADEMGLGKTVQMIALIWITKDDQRPGEAGTLIVGPASLLDQWAKEIEEKTNGGLSVVIWRGPNRDNAGIGLRNVDIVLASYEEVRNDATGKGPLMRTPFQRVVLDEAQSIASGTTQKAEAVYDLIARARWCLTGTPVMNSLRDAWALFRFLQIPQYRDPAWFKKNITDWQKTNPGKAARTVRAGFKICLIRRRKDNIYEGQPIVPLAEKKELWAHARFWDKTQMLYDDTASAAKTWVERAEGRLDNKQLELTVLKLRRLCDHPYLVSARANVGDRDLEYDSGEVDPEELLIEWEEDEIAAALELVNKRTASWRCSQCKLEKRAVVCITPCKRIICQGKSMHCLEQERTKRVMRDCTMANCKRVDGLRLAVPRHYFRGSVDEPKGKNIGTLPAYVQEAVDDGCLETEKFRWIKNRIRFHLDEDPETRFIVVSQWTMALDLLDEYFKQELREVKIFRFQGGMNPDQRHSVVEAFQKRSSKTHKRKTVKGKGKAKDKGEEEEEEVLAKVLLLSIEAGGTGLNLMSASVAFFLEPHYNPAKEDQAVGRIHRLGQTKVVHIYHMLMKRTVERGIIGIQKYKRDLIKGSLGKAKRYEGDKNMNEQRRSIVSILDQTLTHPGAVILAHKNTVWDEPERDRHAGDEQEGDQSSGHEVSEDEGYSGDEYSGDQYSEDQYSGDQYSGDEYSGDEQDQSAGNQSAYQIAGYQQVVGHHRRNYY